MNAAARNLRDLFDGFDVDVPAVEVSDISTRAQRVIPGGAFLACAGARHHGLEFIDAAIAAGAAAVAWEPTPGIDVPRVPGHIAAFAVPDLGARLGTIADRFFGAPSSEMSVTGITGTNGKTTTAHLVCEALSRLGRSAAYMGTLGYGLNGRLAPSSMTTPGCVTVHRRLRELAGQGATHAIAEVSSHALDQRRVSGVRFDVAALTNLSRDHLDYHGDMERYAEAKARLFLDYGIRAAVINVGNEFGARLAGRLPSGTDMLSVALIDADDGPADARLTGTLTSHHEAGVGLKLGGDFGEALIESTLWGRFNGENLVVSAGVLLALGWELSDAATVLSECAAPPGRMQVIGAGHEAPTVVVDFAHTPEALRAALHTARDHCRGELWCVFGCGGDRDQGKRLPMGEVAAVLADHCVVTDDNPRSEDPQAIAGEIVKGTRTARHTEVIHDRAAAINYAIHSADADDVVLIAGKGHESVQIVGNQQIQFSDAVVARVALGLDA